MSESGLNIIGHVECGFAEKFGIPRQSGIAQNIRGRLVMHQPYSDPAAFKGIEEFSHLWVIWLFEGFSGNDDGCFTPTVRPPRLGGNETKGVFATRSPNRPNHLAMSSVRLEGVSCEDGKTILEVSGLDMRDGTKIVDIKPYLAYTDAHPEATQSYAGKGLEHELEVVWEIPRPINADDVADLLRLDPRPAYQNDPARVYGLSYAGFNFNFRVEDDTAHIIGCEKL